MLVESLVLCLAGALCGLYVARILSRYLVTFLSTQGVPIQADLSPDSNDTRWR